MKPPKVAIVILNWNGEKLLPQFLPSVIEYSRQDDVELIVADNHSSDGSIQVLKDQFPQVKILPLETNYGFARGYNEALKQIQARYYIVLNSDVEVSPNWIDPLVRAMDDDPTVAAVQPKILSWHQKDTFEYAGAAGGFIDKLGFPFCRGRILDVLEKDEGQYDQQISIFWASGACLAIRADLFHEAGGFDADFWAHMEEIDLCWRLKNRGYKILFVPESKVFHLGGGSLSYNNPRKLFLNFRNSLWLLYKNVPRRKFWKVMLTRMFLDGIAALRLLAEGNVKGFASVFKAHLAYYRELPVLRQKRRELREMSAQEWHVEILCKSIIWKYYLKGEKTFRELS
ncbi:glycosyltransferase family 2 protein [Gaoshiqia sp. Z1-71]|uniref:glycosyltransferase family 2 protein n=1 Tax=Gaoshiqia hydrogeniformans TaxID=3290090 RepID=UPI003BF80C73